MLTQNEKKIRKKKIKTKKIAKMKTKGRKMYTLNDTIYYKYYFSKIKEEKCKNYLYFWCLCKILLKRVNKLLRFEFD